MAVSRSISNAAAICTSRASYGEDCGLGPGSPPCAMALGDKHGYCALRILAGHGRGGGAICARHFGAGPPLRWGKDAQEFIERHRRVAARAGPLHLLPLVAEGPWLSAAQLSVRGENFSPHGRVVLQGSGQELRRPFGSKAATCRTTKGNPVIQRQIVIVATAGQHPRCNSPANG